MIKTESMSETSCVIPFKVGRYLELLKEYMIHSEEEEALIRVSEFGRELLLSGVPPEEAGEIHQMAVGQLAQEYSDISLKEATVLFSSPLVELLMAYGLAFREQIETHHEKHLDLFTTDTDLVPSPDPNLKEKRLYQTEKEETVGALLSWVSHDLNNILSIVLGYSELTMNLSASDSKVYKNLQQILIAGGRAKNLSEQMQSFIRDDEMALCKISPATLCQDYFPFFQSGLSERIGISLQVADLKDEILIDPLLISLAVFNIATFLGQWAGAPGVLLRIHLDQESVVAPIPDIRLPFGLYLRITISGGGPGSCVSNPDMIFHPLFLGPPTMNNGNIGMTVALRIVTRHKGIIRVMQDPAEEMQFQIYLPYSQTHFVFKKNY